MSRGRVVLAMSGGVDSSVAAHLLARDGYDVVGLFMRTGVQEEAGSCETPGPTRKIRGCCSAVDAADARRVADRLDLPFYALNFSEEFDQIKDYFVDEYLAGRTPNPCVVCNTWLKFGKLWEYAEGINADFIATGHYAQIGRWDSGAPALCRAVDSSKDQSYFLFGIRRDLLDRILFPIGHLTKAEVRAIAEEAGLAVAQKRESQEVCFVPDGQYQSFIRRHRPAAQEAPGTIIDTDGQVLGEHEGVSGFTIGQRKGLGIAVGEPRFVLEIRPESHQVVIGPRELLAQSALDAERVEWLSDQPPQDPVPCQVKIRYLHVATPATVVATAGGGARVVFDEPQNAVTPGQATVFYQDDRVLGGGWIV